LISLDFAPNLSYYNRPEETFMSGYSLPAILCTICAKPLNLVVDLCADENGKAVHEECYLKRITTPRSRPPDTSMSDEVQIAHYRIGTDVGTSSERAKAV
jgi:hypothetical protein